MQNPVVRDNDLAASTQKALTTDDTASLRFYNGNLIPPVPTETPVAYMSDFLLQFNPPNAGDGAQVGIVIDGLPRLRRSDLRARSQGSSLPTRQCEAARQQSATPRIAFSIKEETGSQAGDGTQGSYGEASATGAGLVIVDGGDATDSASLLLGERTGTRSFDFTAQNMVLDDTDGTTATLTQTIDRRHKRRSDPDHQSEQRRTDPGR